MNGKATLGFHPSYHAKNFGVDYGEKYHKDPIYRTEQGHKCERALYERFGEYGMGDPAPKVKAISIGIQPLDFLNGALGGRMLYNPHESVWTPDKPLEHIETMEDLEKMPDIDWDNNPVYLDDWRQIDEMKELYPDLPVTAIQGASSDGEACSFVMHTPYTTAFRLLGDRIFELMLLEKDLANGIFDYLMRQYLNLWENIRKRMNWPEEKQHLHFGDCAATMLSPDLYEKFCLPLYQKLMENYKTCTIHSCGASTHLLDLFTEVPNAKILQLGKGTKLEGLRKKFPNANISAYFASPDILHGTPQSIEKQLWEMAEELESDFQINGSSVDPESPPENIKAYLDTAMKVNEEYK
jgi:hypothetical protein